ncbi:MAG: protein kinase [Chloracidobacterium sp.]|nr:protein kinase [Chloracidobacterium sp.]
MEVFCPKCGQSFEKGSRRFCPTDGRRLVAEELAAEGQSKGVFANLIPQIEAISDLEKTLPNLTPPAPAPHTSESLSGAFFELDDPGLDPFAPDALPAIRPAEPSVRKVDPSKIPTSHIDLADNERLPPLEFNENKPEEFIGRIVKGRYKVVDLLGGDDNGLAYIADDKLVEDKKVLVRILTDEGHDEITESLLAEERVSLSHLTHPNIARLVDSGQFLDGTPFLISEYVDALSVRDILGIHGRFEPQRAARIIRQAASALNEAHQQGVLHRDVRPENLIIDASSAESEHVTVVNFGSSESKTSPHHLAFRAPEVLEGRAATASSDIYSLGAVAFEMLTGSKPFYGDSVKEVLRAQSAGVAVNGPAAAAELPRSVADVLHRALAYSSSERYVKARDFGDAFVGALSSAGADEPVVDAPPIEPAVAVPAVTAPKVVRTEKLPPAAEPAWKARSPEPPAEETSRFKLFAGIALAALVAMLVLGWYLWVREPAVPETSIDANIAAPQANTIVPTTEMPPLARTIPQPPNTNFYQNSKQNLKGDLLRNFVGFTLYYPKEWKVNGPQQGESAESRGKFLDISRNTPDDRMQEQMLISYYPSKGTFTEDAEKFPMMVKETNETLKKILPGYMEISEGEITVNGGWRAYEVRFQAGGRSPAGEALTVWGRRLFIPAARPGVKSGFEITMLATSLADGIQGVDDVGVRGELASVLYSFEPTQNF